MIIYENKNFCIYMHECITIELLVFAVSNTAMCSIDSILLPL